MPNACVVTTYGRPDVLEWTRVPMPEPSERQVRIKVRVSGVGPTDLKIRRGDLEAVFPLPEPTGLEVIPRATGGSSCRFILASNEQESGLLFLLQQDDIR